MIVTFFGSKGGGSAGASIDYLMNKEPDKVDVLKGDPKLSLRIAERLTFKNTYTVGCLSFEEKNIPDVSKREIIERFENSLFAGLEADQYNITWIEHRDKGRLELNFFIPNVELTTGKRLQPYWDKADRPLVENFKQVINHEYKLSDPNSPEKKQTLINRKDLPETKQKALETINRGISNLIQSGKVNNRDDVINALEGSGFEIARLTDKNISIKTDGQNLRLKGAFYEKSFRLGDNFPKELGERTRDYRERYQERYQTARERLESAVGKRKSEFERNYVQRDRTIDESIQKEYKDTYIYRNRFIANSINDISVSHVSIGKDVQRYDGMGTINEHYARIQSSNNAQELSNIGRTETLRDNRSKVSEPKLARQLQDNKNNGNDQDKGKIKGQDENGDRERNSFATNIRDIARTTIERASYFIERVRDFANSIFRDNPREQQYQETAQRIDDINGDIKQQSKEVERYVIKQELEFNKVIEKELTL